MIVGELRSYGEEAVAEWAWNASQEELRDTLTVAEWLLHFGPAPQSSGSMLFAKAIALGCVYVHEGHPRELARKRRDLALWRESAEDLSPKAQERIRGRSGNYVAVGPDARSYWS